MRIDRNASILLVMAVFLMGSWSGFTFRAMQPVTEEKFDASLFGFNGVTRSDFPECQTDMLMTTDWSTELMYLNGVWTAACVAEGRRRQRLVEEEEK